MPKLPRDQQAHRAAKHPIRNMEYNGTTGIVGTVAANRVEPIIEHNQAMHSRKNLK